jgi:hypothetical protein
VAGFVPPVDGFVPPAVFFVPPETTGLPVILSTKNFVPAPITAPVTAFTTLPVMGFVVVFVGVITGLTIDVGVVVLIVGVVGVFVVITGFEGITGLGVPMMGLVVIAGFVVIGFVVIGFVVIGFVVKSLVNLGFLIDIFGDRPAPPEDVIALLPPTPPVDVTDGEKSPEIAGPYPALRITLLKGLRSRPRASGSCLLDVLFLRIAMSYPVFLTNEVKPAIFPTGLSFAVLGKVLGGPTVVGFPTKGAF